jgi:hypothetical protein
MDAEKQPREMAPADRFVFWTIALSNAAFVAVLALAAYWEPEIVWLHLFQALSYGVIVLLAAQGNRWGYFLGIGVSAVWIYLTTFAGNFVESGFTNLGLSIQQGAVVRADQIIAVPAFLLQLTLMVACMLAYLRLPNRRASDLARLLVSLIAALSYLVALFALFEPKFLYQLPMLLHPHLP